MKKKGLCMLHISTLVWFGAMMFVFNYMIAIKSYAWLRQRIFPCKILKLHSTFQSAPHYLSYSIITGILTT